jgi:PAS domain S-box-containing protein
MQESIFLGLVNNAALLLALWAIYSLVSMRTSLESLWEKVLAGLAIGILGIAVMFSTMPFSPGVVFDTRSILLSISGLFFGPVPAVIAAVMTALFRLYQGGVGVTMGILVITTSTAIGCGWRYLRKKQDRGSDWLELYLFGVVVHIVMFIDAFALPPDIEAEVFRSILLPVMLIYPVGTVALGVLFSNQLARKKLGVELAKSEEKYRKIVETAEEGICTFDKEGNYVFINQKFADLSGYSLEELYGRPYGEMLSPQAKMLVDEKVRNRQKGIREDYDLQLIRKDGELIWTNVSANPIYDTEGNYAGALAMYTDITARVRLQEEYRKSEEYYRILYQQSPLPYQSLDADGCFKDVNQIWLESLGYSREEVIGKWFGDFLAADDRKHFRQKYSQFKHVGEIHDVEFEMQLKGGEVIFVSFDGRIRRSEQGEFEQAYCVWRDVTQIRKAQKALLESEEKLRALTNYLQSAIETDRAHLAREIHDEFGQLLTGLKMDLAWFKRNTKNDPVLIRRLELMDELIDDAIQISRRLASELRPGLLDDLGLVPAMEWYAGEFQRRSGIKCLVTFPDEEPDLNSALKTTVYRIFQEALTNIARHAEASKASIQLAFDAGILKLEIRDNGRGITSNELSDNRSLGLLGMQERARQKGGSVEILGKVGTGTRVTARFPISEYGLQEVVS